MLVSSRGSLMALLWTSAAVATSSLIAEPIFGRDLEVRQDATKKCPDSYTSKNGLNFTTYCEQNNPFNDAQDPFNSPSMQDCMEHCSRYWGNGEGCFGVVWVSESGNCWLRNSTTSTAGLTSDPGNYAALIKNGEMNPLEESCPNSDLSINSLPGVEGIQYTTHCGKVIGGFDDCFSGYPSCWDSPYVGFFHTETLEECLRICIDQQPLCRAVSWNPGLEIGFANCWPKTGFPTTLTDPTSKQGVLHSATITQIDPIDTDCPSEQTYAAQGSKNFEIHCGQLNTGTNITSLHTQNVTACMDACATSDKKCVGVLFDSSLQGGYKNCYLQNTTSVITDQASATYAILAGTSLPSSSASPSAGSGSGNNNSSSSGGGSKAWIAGPVIGGIAALAILGFALFWWRRRKAKRGVVGVEKGPSDTHGGYGPAPAYSPGAGAQQHYYDAPASEMDARPTSELPASTKYAHADGGAAASKASPASAPHELP
ncbi:Nn.00g021640.m01.CDS01 [Neocucurbitaria sp. VM-36]